MNTDDGRKNTLFPAIDLGATNIAAAIVKLTESKAGNASAGASIVRRASVPTRAKRPAREIIKDIAELLLCLLEEEGLGKQDVAGVGIGIPGVAVAGTGMVHCCPNLFWHRLDLGDMLQEQSQLPIRLPIFVANDANCAALAELHFGSFRGRKNAVLITLGSGVGGGVILNGKLYTGTRGAAGEIGHMILHLDGEPCACGNQGCFERYASADALVRAFADRVSSSGIPYNTSAGDTPSSDLPLSTKEILEAAKNGDRRAVKSFKEYACNLAKGIASVINLYDPEIISLGGGISLAGEFLLSAVRKEVAENTLFKDFPGMNAPKIALAELGNDAGLIGAALYAKQNIKQEKRREGQA